MLSGTLDTFSVGEILSLLGESGATGALRIESGGDEGQVFCRDGEVTYAAVRSEEQLGDLLVRAGFVADTEWSDLTGDPQPAKRLSETLDRKGVESKRVQRFLARHTEESLFELDRWSDGELHFERDSDHPLSDFFRYPSQPLLRSVQERLATWGPMIETLGSVDRIIGQAPVPPGDEDEMSVNRTQLKVLSHVDGRRTVRALSRLLGLGLHETCVVVTSLLTDGLVVLLDSPTSAPAAPVAEPAPIAASPAPVNGNGASANGSANGNGHQADAPADAAGDAGSGATEFVEPGDGPARDLILRLLSAVKEEL